ncbi:hypothetical protein K402DRAFT_398886 [Aulographum hederae CBS 113979]|uniref:ER-bound oxygenase mpaB/mpaB'/Rubber oxygenase catalytic domain-containing protein n=1 Tax=Aulographum hederae CBS 113979 TaxID=1176131 RepID=A0A6G1GJY6_9PEZI|nr:hypothetical protein K402DRAFT_398886 [Aulographum hederae CBS 113979]
MSTFPSRLSQIWPFSSSYGPVLLVFMFYLALVRLLRYRRRDTLLKRYNYPTRESYSKMTVDDAQAIQIELNELEFPFMFQTALELALFKTYGIPTISTLLTHTRQLTTRPLAPKRYVDTSVLIHEFCGNPRSSSRYQQSIARMNYLHSVYLKDARISNADLLYTLSLFALEPMRWMARYEWRELGELEKAAVGTFWCQVGRDMEVGYGELEGAEGGWRDGLEWLEDVEAWSRRYEERCMVPHGNNKVAADRTTELLLWGMPEGMRERGVKVVSVLMEERLRKAMMYPPPPASYTRLLTTTFTLRKLALRHLTLPRLLRRKFLSPANKHGRYHPNSYANTPLYVKPTLWQRMSPQAWAFWLVGKPIPGDQEVDLQPEGYDLWDVGPKSFKGEGRESMVGDMERIGVGMGEGRCPFSL